MSPSVFRFDRYEVNVRTRELWKGGARVRLQDQPFQILAMMLERAGDVVTREEIRARLWPDGTTVDFEHSVNAAIKRLRAALGDMAEEPRYVETLPRRGYRFLAPVEQGAVIALSNRKLPRDKPRLVVLPFANLSDMPAQDYFSDGLTEELIAQLGHLFGTRIGVIARTSSMLLKGGRQTASEIGRGFGARYLIEGSVRREGDWVRVTAQLIETDGETHSVGRKLQPAARRRPRRAERGGLGRRPFIADRAAAWGVPRRTDRDARSGRIPGVPQGPIPLEQARGCRSAGRDSSTSTKRSRSIRISAPLIQAARAASSLSPSTTGTRRARRSRRRAGPPSARCSSIPTMPRRISRWVKYAVPSIGTRRGRSRNTAKRSRRTRASMPCTAVLRCFSPRVDSLRRPPRSSDRASDLDPFCFATATSAAMVRYFAREYDEVIRRCRHIVDMDPDYLPARRLIAAALELSGRAGEAVAELEPLQDDRQDAVSLACLGRALALSGNRRRALAMRDRLARLEDVMFVPAHARALLDAALGDADAAIAELEAACEQRDPWLDTIGLDPRFEALHDDPRFRAILSRLRIEATAA